MNNRYKELIEENNNLLKNIKEPYFEIADIYIKKARGYGVHSEDTEIKIRNTLSTILEYSEKDLEIEQTIPSRNTFIEEEVHKLSKEYRDPDKIKGIIIAAVCIAVCIIWGSISCYVSRQVYLPCPENISISEVKEEDENIYVTVSWTEVYKAENYVIYYECDGRSSTSYKTNQTSYTLLLEKGKDYQIKVYCDATLYFGKSVESVINYPEN